MIENINGESTFLVKFVLEMYLLGFVVLLVAVAYGISAMGWRRFRSDIRGSVKYLLRHF